jgi:ABC-type multidrug transport system fused ATPase/permease subunit
MTALRARLREQKERIGRLVGELLKDSESYEGKVRDDLGRLWREYLAEHRVPIAVAVVMTLLWSTHGYIFALAAEYLVDEVIQLGADVRPEFDQQLPLFVRWASIVLGTWTGVVITQWVRSWLILDVGRSLVYRLRTTLHEKLQVLHIGYFERQETGKLMSRVMEDVWIIREWATNKAINISANIFQLIVGLAVSFSVEWRLTGIMVLTMPFYFWAFVQLRPAIRRLNIAMRRLSAGMYARSQERISGVAVVKAFDQERRETLNFRQRMNNFVRLAMRVVNYRGVMVAIAGTITAVTTGLVIYLGFAWVRAGTLTMGEIVFFMNVMPRLFNQVNALSQVFVEIQAVFVVIKRVFNLLDEPVDVTPGPIELDDIKGSVFFEHVSFRHPGQARSALSDVSFYVEAGQKVALMGPSGAGKTTVFNLILRFYDPERGAVYLDGVNLVNAVPASIRSHAVVVQQEPIIFSGTIAENIVYGRQKARPSQIMEAARQSELHDFIMTLPVKYETEVGQNGISLSGGQKQRLALATALLTRPEILLLDDTTSALDAETEARVRATLDHVLEGRTSIIITQRIATARSCDRIIVLDDGQIAQQGTHEELKQVPGFYQKILIQQESL